jgi:hypothetical protein
METNKNSSKILRISLLLLVIDISLSLGINSTSAANPSNIYLSTNGNDNWNGLNSTHITGINGPKASNNNTTSTVKSGGTVYITNGIYKESNITIDTNMDYHR